MRYFIIALVLVASPVAAQQPDPTQLQAQLTVAMQLLQEANTRVVGTAASVQILEARVKELTDKLTKLEGEKSK
jgi:uncharacterized protein involved in exopolysaccharide biosynthesis